MAGECRWDKRGNRVKLREVSMKAYITMASVAALSVGLLIDMPAAADPFVFSTGNPDALLGALSRPASPGKIETETADDFVLTEATVISRATIHGLIVPSGLPVSNITRVEIETYHVFPIDSNTARTPLVPTRTNSPADVEIDAATRDSSDTTLSFGATLLNASFKVLNTVVNGISGTKPFTGGEGSATGGEVEIDITFTPPIFLPAGHFFFRPEVQVTGGNFLYLSAPKPIVPPGTPFPAGSTDLQSWIRNTFLDPDWLRVGADIVGPTPATAPTFN